MTASTRNLLAHCASQLHVSLGLCLVVAALYWPVGQYGFINYDDPLYVTENRQVQRGVTVEGALWAFRDMRSSNWHPLTWLSHMLDWELFGSNAGGHHGMNVFLHLLNVLLLFHLLNGMTGAVWRSACVALFFAIHPMNIESVAWVAERKNLLSTSLALLTIFCYSAYVRQPEWKRYLTTNVVYALCLTAKPMLVTMPFLLLLLDYWPLQRLRIRQKSKGAPDFGNGPSHPTGKRLPLRGLMLEKVPLIVLAALSSVVTILAASEGGALKSLDQFPLSVRLTNSLNAYAGYIEKLIWPQDLSVLYPHAGFLPVGEIVAAGLLIGGLSVLIIANGRDIRYLTVGWFWFLGTLVPVIGLVQVGIQAMADRYTYVPCIGLFLLLVWGGVDLMKSAKSARVLLVLACGVTVLYWGVTAHRQLQYWRSSRTLFAHTLRVNPQNAVARNNLAHALFEEGQWDEAIMNYEQAIRIDPLYANAHNNMGAVLARQGRTDEAVVQYRRAIEINPRHAGAYYNLELAMQRLGRSDEAEQYRRLAEKLDPHRPQAKPTGDSRSEDRKK